MTKKRRENPPKGVLLNNNAPATANGASCDDDAHEPASQWSAKRSIYFIVCLAGLCWLAVAAIIATWF